eukprot:6319721-Pyramimonas_sp.AAC.1
MERKHRVAKNMIAPRRNTVGYEFGLMAEISVQHLFDLEHHLLFNVDMLAPHPPSKKLMAAIERVFNLDGASEVLTSRSVFCGGRA